MKSPANSDKQPRKMPVGKPFQKGQSGNPSGRPKGLAEMQAVARDYTIPALEKLAKLIEDDDGRVSVAAIREMMDRGWGKAAQAIVGADGGAIEVRWSPRIGDVEP